jgi:endonuclease III
MGRPLSDAGFPSSAPGRTADGPPASGKAMKNSKEHAQRLQKLYRGLKRGPSSIERTLYEDPVDAMIYGVVCEHRSEAAAQRAMKRFRDSFVDWNDVRVARIEEIAEVFQDGRDTSRATAKALTTMLHAIFDEHHALSLQSLKKQGKRPAKQVLDEMKGISPFVVHYCMLTSLEGHAIPLTAGMTAYLKDNQIVDPGADDDEIQGFLTRHIPAKDAYDFYGLLRQEAETAKPAKKKAPAKGKTSRGTKTKK